MNQRMQKVGLIEVAWGEVKAKEKLSGGGFDGACARVQVTSVK